MKFWNTIDKSEWLDRGEWDNEPDKVQWIDKETGLDCLIVRANMSGALCGYVGVPESSFLYGVDYNRVSEHFDVHFGLTFSGKCIPSNDPSIGICHSGDVANKCVWWLGFDCSHSDDISPAYFNFFKERGLQPDGVSIESHRLLNSGEWRTYKNIDYVIKEVESLATKVSNYGM